MHIKSLLGHADWLAALAELLKLAGCQDLSQDYFAAEKDQTVTKFAFQRGVPCIQLELSETRLNLFNKAELARMTSVEIEAEVSKGGTLEGQVR